MTSNWDADDLVLKHSENIGIYKKNFLRQVVCEFRFPTMMEFGDPSPPVQFVKAIRLDYPHLDLANEVKLGIRGGMPGSNNAHIFRSAKLDWTVSLKQSTLSIETTKYQGFEQMRARIMKIVDAAMSIIDSDFFTRVGLRYVNLVTSEEDPSDGWINPDLVAPLVNSQFIKIQDYAGKLQFGVDDGGCLLQHGVRLSVPTKSDVIVPEYLIDIDVFRNEVALGEVADALQKIHAQAFDIFDWSIGPKARAYLQN